MTTNLHPFWSISHLYLSFFRTTLNQNEKKIGTTNVNPIHINSTLHWFACVGGGEDNYQVSQEIQKTNFESKKNDFDYISGDEGTDSLFETFCMDLCVI